jgi:rhodanese-related sulfurtransferase
MRISIPFLLLGAWWLLPACKNQTTADQQAGSKPSNGATTVQAPVNAAPIDTILVTLKANDFYKVTLDKPNMAIFDVRTPEDFKEGHIYKAVNLPFNDPNLIQKLTAMGRDNYYGVYCGTGVQSKVVAERMKDMGFKHIYFLNGGLLGWGDTGQALQLK